MGPGGLDANAVTCPSSNKAEERPTLIDSTWVDVVRYRGQAKGLRHYGEDLDRLVARWSVWRRSVDVFRQCPVRL
jgi:hypothetical protein